MILLSCIFGIYFTAHAATIDTPLMHAAQEKTAHHIFRELRCVVCAGQSLAESDATLAVQMRAHVRELVAQGKTEDEILAHFRARYGDQILLTPPLEQKTALLWLGPALLLGGGLYAVWRMTRPQNSAVVLNAVKDQSRDSDSSLRSE